MKYTPKINDYVKYENSEGWIYWVDEHGHYLTIEVSVKCKDEENILHCPIHKMERCLLICYASDWGKLVYVKSR